MTPEEHGERVGRALYPADERLRGYVAGLVAGAVREAVAAVTNPEPADAVRAERWRLATAIRGGPTGGPCACAGCKHAANCRCGCPECAAESAVAAERERCAKIADAEATEAGDSDGEWASGAFRAAEAIAAAIRGLS